MLRLVFLFSLFLTPLVMFPASPAAISLPLATVHMEKYGYTPALSQDILIEKGDNAVSKADMRDVATILQKYSIPILSKNLAPSVDTPIVIKLFGHQADFQNALKTYFPAAYHRNPIVTMNGFTVNTTVFLPMYQYKDGMHSYYNPDLSNYLTHESTHAMVNALHISIPTWVNEGFAWYNGMEAETELDAPFSSVLANESYYSFVLAAQRGVLVPLTQTEADIVNNPYYNVEFEDYLAVSELIVADGFPSFRHFLSLSRSLGSAMAYKMTYHNSISQYETFFYDYNEQQPAP